MAIEIPADFPVRPLADGDSAKDPVYCATCELRWDDAIPTAYTPAPSARCPFEAFHVEETDAAMSEAALFFYEHAGWGYSPDNETPEQGRERCARELARAEFKAREAGVYVTVEHDPDVMEDDADSVGMVERGEAVNLTVILWRPDYSAEGLTLDPTMLGSMGGVVVASESDPYVRVVAAELADEYGDF